MIGKQFYILVWLALLMTTLILAAGCNDGVLLDDCFDRVTGTVTDSITGVPLESAEIEIRRLNRLQVVQGTSFCYTDTLGQYVIGPPCAEHYELLCRKEGYLTKYVKRDRPEPGPFTVDFHLSPAEE